MRDRVRSARGAALVEAAIVTPIVLLIMVGIFEVGRAYQTFQVVTNAAREGARAAVVPGADPTLIDGIVRRYMRDGQLAEAAAATVTVDREAQMSVNGSAIGASQVTVDYPFEFMVLQPVARIVVSDSRSGEAFTMRATSLMRNEAQ